MTNKKENAPGHVTILTPDGQALIDTNIWHLVYIMNLRAAKDGFGYFPPLQMTVLIDGKPIKPPPGFMEDDEQLEIARAELRGNNDKKH